MNHEKEIEAMKEKLYGLKELYKENEKMKKRINEAITALIEIIMLLPGNGE